ncbi:MAG: serine hydrolase [Armatimonadota bacterium]|nr:serine hydrolase [Armatimonadota bacterium]MDR7471251.1 serine hydrolase [Armatimonadota bacterium]MDR7515988.1 serine hydrolase [Armatimonadota bacterium]MDR7586983.1 serine hydrolase [Armatimonadota bacterium]MDR7612377.1 serine hydrolase [Armatimonadota bacterium]
MALLDARPAIDRLISQAPGTVGLVIRDLASGTSLEWASAERFPAASIIKIPVLVEALRQVQEGRLRLHDRVAISARAKVGGFGILKELESVGELTLRDLLTLMIIISDNTAANLCIDLVGMDRVNDLLASLNLGGTVLQRKMMDMEARQRGLDNFTTPDDTARLLELLATRRVLDPELCDLAIGILSRQQVRDRIPLLLPPDVTVAHKTGELPEIRHDAGIIFSTPGPLIVAAFTKGFSTPLGRGLVGGEASTLIAEISRMAYDAVTSS